MLPPLLYWDPGVRTIAQQGAFSPICHRLSPFVLPDKQNATPPPSPVVHSPTWDQLLPLFSCLTFSGDPFLFIELFQKIGV